MVQTTDTANTANTANTAGITSGVLSVPNASDAIGSTGHGRTAGGRGAFHILVVVVVVGQRGKRTNEQSSQHIGFAQSCQSIGVGVHRTVDGGRVAHAGIAIPNGATIPTRGPRCQGVRPIGPAYFEFVVVVQCVLIAGPCWKGSVVVHDIHIAV